MERYRKFLVALATVIAVAIPLIQEGISVEEGLALALAFLGALGVYAVPNATEPPIDEIPVV